jgi:large repetitive protein
MPVDVTVECNEVPVAPAIVTASDNCDSDVLVEFIEVRTDGSCPDTYNLTRTWTATDNCGNSITHVQVIFVEDTTAPVWDQVMPVDITVECDGVPAAPAVVTASDNCDADVTVVFSEVRTDGACPDTYTLTRTWTATDNCGNSITHVQVISVEDTTAPVWDQVMPADITVECDALPAAPAMVTASDNCDSNVLVEFTEARTDGVCPDTYTLTRTWTATDNCGNSITHVQVISVEDTTAPVWDQVMPVDITVECDGVPAAPAVVTALDNCDSDVTVVFVEVRTDGACEDTYTLTRTWTATDNCGNSITHVQVISVEDTTAPVWDQVMPVDITVECDALPAAPAVVTASDNCDSNVLVEFTEARTDGVCPDTYTLTRTWTATDNCGNSITHVQVISVEDTSAPVWDQVMPVDITVECDALPAAPAVVTASDNCDSNVLVEFTEARTDGVCPDTYTLTRTWTATDNCGNSITHVQVISVEDTSAPVWDQVMPVDITVECDGVPAAPAVVTASDNCDADVTVVFGEVRTDGSCPDTYTLTRTWTATDNCGNSITHVQVITVEDTTAPVWDQAMPADITVECDGVPAAPAVVTASDNCESDVTVVFGEVRNDGACIDSYTLTRTWTATDNCGNETIHVQIITVEDITAPVWDQVMPVDVTVECNEVPVAPAIVTASDNCDSDVLVEFIEVRTDGSCPDTYNLTRTWTATDNCGNSITHVQVISVEDTTAPVWDQVMPVDITVECDGVPAAPAVVTALDNCDSDVTVVFVEVRTDGACEDTYTLTRTWTATDNCGNSITHVQVISFEDTTAPVWDQVMPVDVTVECNEVPVAPAIVTASDNCDSDVLVEFIEVRTDGSCPDTYNLTRTWTATDNCGNVSVHTQIIAVGDNTPPVITCPDNIMVNADNGEDFATVVIPVPVASDNCGSFTLTNDFNGTDNASGLYPVGVTTVTYTVTDECGNSTTCSFTVTVQDDEAPVINCPPTITVSCISEVPAPYANYAAFAAAGGLATDNNEIDEDSFILLSETSDNLSCPETITRTYQIADNDGNTASCQQIIIVNDLVDPTWDQAMPVDLTVECDGVPEAPAVVTASDNCDADVLVEFTEVRTDGVCADTYTLNRTWTATDNCGNSITHVQVISVEDTTAPVWDQVMPVDLTVECDGVPAAPAVVTASDNCDSEVLVEFSEVRTDGACADTYTLTRTWTATDNCGNSITHVQVISVEDTTAPVWDQVMPVDITVECDGVPAAPAVVTASDNCDSDVTVVFSEVRTDGACPDTYTLTRTWTATDNCGNSITHVQVISVEDTTAPVWDQVMPADITVECDALPAAPAVVTASDNCDSNVLVEFTEARTDGVCPDTYTLTRTWTATDNCGNTITHVQVISVEDTTAPVWDQVMPVDITVECDGVPAAPAVVTASDNCDSEVLVEFSEVRTDGACADTYTLTRTWTATDNCGNSITHTQTITIQDTTDPVFVEDLPQDVTVECNAVPQAVTLTATDNCDTDVPVVYNEVRTDGACIDSYILTRTWTATDNCGNSITHTQTITVQDTTDPVFVEDLPQNVTVECNAVPQAVTLTATDNCDTDVPVVYNEVRTDGACIDSYILTRNWTATDNCGNSITHVQVISVEDTTAPVWDQVMPTDITVECDGVPAAPAVVTVSDNCDSDVLVEFTEVRTDGSCPDTYTLTRTWTATDNCGNSITHVQVISVEDTTAPVWDQVMPADITVECDGVPAAPAVVTASDNCDSNVLVEFTEVRTDGSCPDTYTLIRTWTATDNCGNSITHIQTITVEDTTAPIWDQVMPVDITVECNVVPDPPAVVTATDNCDTDVTITFTEVRIDGACIDSYTLTRNWTAYDNCGNSITHIQTITVEDTTAPTWDQVMPVDITVECNVVPDPPALVTATDNCGEATVTFEEVRTDGTCPFSYILTRTWTATDECENETVHVQTITVQDTTPPVFVEALPGNITVECDEVPVAVTLTATDNCGEVTVTFEEVRTDGTCPFSYILTRTWTATDECENETVHVQTITVQDTTPPVFVEELPTDMTVECDEVPAAITLTAIDNCGEATVTFEEVRTDGTCPFSYILTRTWTATDECENETVHVQTITVQDTTPPVFVEALPGNITVECDEVPAAVTLTAIDNCGEAVVTFEEVRTDGDCPFSYILTRTWTATDECENETVHVQTITVQDTTPPVFVEELPTDMTVECDEVPAAITLTAIDNCGEATVTFEEVRTDGTCPFSYILTRTWTATDECSNKYTHVQVITVEDTTAPTWNQAMPADAIVECDGIPEPPEVVTATDNCDADVTVVFTEVRTDGICPDSYTLTRTWTATDNCGNESIHVQVIEVGDNTPPVIICPEDIAVNVDPGEDFATVIIPVPFASDNCGSFTLTNDYTGTDNASGQYPVGVTIVTYIATDECGNISTCSFSVTVQDDEPPEITCPGTITVSCIFEVPEPYASYAEFETAGGFATDNNEIDEDSFILLSETSDNQSCPETITRIYQISDFDGNTATCEQIIIVNDLIAPIWDQEMPSDLTVECDAVPNPPALVTATDNCGEATVTFEEVRTDGGICGTCGNLWSQLTATDNCGEAVVTFEEVRTAPARSDRTIATDECENETVHVQTITVQDTTPPVLPGNITVEWTSTAIDNCGEATL